MKTKQTKATPVNHEARNAVTAALASAYEQTDNTGSHIHTVCESAQKHYKGAVIPKDDIDNIALSVSAARGWKGRTVDSRMSEIRVILRAYAQLAEAVKSLRDKIKSCTWHDAVALARALNNPKYNTVPKAVSFVRSNKESNGTSGGAVNPAGRAAGALKAWYKKSNSEKRAVIVKAVKLLQTIGLKLELA